MLEAAIEGSGLFRRVRVLRETGSTQDAARGAAAGQPGLILTAGVQTGGRGQHGRVWEQGAGLGVAVTYVVGAGDSRRLSMAAGLAALEACDAMLGVGGRLGIKAPNDVVTVGEVGARKKLAGVLIEQGGGVGLIGVGINVGQVAHDFPEALRDTGTSLRMLGSARARVEVLVALTRAMERWLKTGDVDAAWRARVVDSLPAR